VQRKEQNQTTKIVVTCLIPSKIFGKTELPNPSVRCLRLWDNVFLLGLNLLLNLYARTKSVLTNNGQRFISITQDWQRG
jgi:hypothetical protein